ncbi:MAG TPA: DNA polymerase III subunit beta [Burkholderiales bacterium]|nr:DNA polymerase III subunit beta [Burkholderiales bacterium]
MTRLLQLERDALLKPLQSVSGIVERRHTLPILSNVLIETSGNTVSFTATDLEIQVSTSVSSDKAVDEQSVTVSARKLLDILRALPENSSVSIELQNGRMSVRAGRSRFSLQTLAAEDFPRLASADGSVTRIKLQQKALRQLLLLVQYSMAQQDIRYYLNGLLLVLEGGELKVVATDGHRLAFASMGVEHAGEKQEVILPRKAVLELVRLLGEEDGEVEIEISAAQVRFAVSGVVVLSKVVDGKFPDYARVIPSGYVKSIALDRVILLQALQRASILSNEKFRGVRWVLTENSLRISCTNTDHEEAQEELEIEYGGEPLDIGFNVTYLLDVLNNVTSGRVECAFGDASSSVLLTLPENAKFRYVVMPMRI